MKRIKLFFILTLLISCMAFECKTVRADEDTSGYAVEEETTEEEDTSDEEDDEEDEEEEKGKKKEKRKKEYTQEEYEELLEELMEKIVALFLGDAEVKLTPEEVEELDDVVNIVWDGEWKSPQTTPVTPSTSWLEENVEVYKETVYQESKTPVEVIAQQAAKEELSVKEVIGGTIMDMGVSHSLDKMQEIVTTKNLEKVLGNADKAKKTWDKFDAISDMVEYINGIGKLSQIIEANEPDMFLQLYLQTGDMFSLAVENNTDVIWEFNSGLWKSLMETEQYKQFVEDNKDNFGEAFWKAAWDGWGECVQHLPLEMKYLAEDLTKLYKEISPTWNLYEWLMGKLKPTQFVNVYKPNIYLYSEEPIEVDVRFTEEQWLTETIPEYSLGWNTRLHGDGDITCQNEQYDFLFYESIASQALVVKEGGWIVEASRREEQLLDILAQYDFNEEETEDFIEFWMEMLEEDVDYVMYPQDTACVDKQMPIVITPQPEQITRLWFAFEEYDGQEVKAPQITPIVRVGFTVVEWGGFFLD